MGARRRGTVTAYASHAGIGTVASDGEEFLLHCTEIPDGSREIAAGTTVEFDVIVRYGVREATAVTVVGEGEVLR
ncbi:MAG: cold shock domain-containing protein [Acidobacteria bacterium]|nr:cold shock domain-containing protein [Acidobacteriota bacterium]